MFVIRTKRASDDVSGDGHMYLAAPSMTDPTCAASLCTLPGLPKRGLSFHTKRTARAFLRLLDSTGRFGDLRDACGGFIVASAPDR